MIFFTVFEQVAVLFILIMLGVILEKTHIFSDEAVKACTDMVLLFVSPSVIIKSFIREFDAQMLRLLLLSFVLSAVSFIVFALLSNVIFHSGNAARERVLRFGAVFSNCGFMSLPLQEALLGDTGVFFGSSFIAIFNLFVWSYGIVQMSGDRKYLSPKKLLINPGIIGFVIGITVYLLSVPVPEIIFKPISYMASLNTPLPMLIIGYHLAKTNIFKAFADIKCLLAVAVRLLGFPLLALGAAYLCGVRGILLVSTVISCAAPTAAITTMFSAKFSADTALSVNMVSMSTVLSIITMPAVITLAQMLSGI